MSVRRPPQNTKATTSQVVAQRDAAEPIETSFAEVVGLIEQARLRAYQAFNSELVGLYWAIGEYISAKLAAAVWREGVVDRLAQHRASTTPGQPGCTRRNHYGVPSINTATARPDRHRHHAPHRVDPVTETQARSNRPGLPRRLLDNCDRHGRNQNVIL